MRTKLRPDLEKLPFDELSAYLREVRVKKDHIDQKDVSISSIEDELERIEEELRERKEERIEHDFFRGRDKKIYGDQQNMWFSSGDGWALESQIENR